MKGLRLLPFAFCLGVALPAVAQDAAQVPGENFIDASKMGVSLSRIQKGLRIAEATEQQRGTVPLRLDIQIQVFGAAPRIDVLKDVDLLNGAVPNAPPTHREVIDFLTPQIYRSPVMPISALMGWAAQQLYDRGRKANCEAEIANYRSLLMQGVNVAAPRCTQ